MGGEVHKYVNAYPGSVNPGIYDDYITEALYISPIFQNWIDGRRNASNLQLVWVYGGTLKVCFSKHPMDCSFQSVTKGIVFWSADGYNLGGLRYLE